MNKQKRRAYSKVPSKTKIEKARLALEEIQGLLDRAAARNGVVVSDTLFILTGLRNMLLRLEYLEAEAAGNFNEFGVR